MIATFKLDDVKDRDEPLSENGSIQVKYVTESVLPLLADAGVWVAPGPSPLDTDETLATFKEIVAHPNYQQQTLQCPDRDGKTIRYKPTTGLVTIEKWTSHEGATHE